MQAHEGPYARMRQGDDLSGGHLGPTDPLGRQSRGHKSRSQASTAMIQPRKAKSNSLWGLCALA